MMHLDKLCISTFSQLFTYQGFFFLLFYFLSFALFNLYLDTFSWPCLKHYEFFVYLLVLKSHVEQLLNIKEDLLSKSCINKQLLIHII